jgi:hypothetical protein
MRTPLCILSDLNLLVFADSRFPEYEEHRNYFDSRHFLKIVTSSFVQYFSLKSR